MAVMEISSKLCNILKNVQETSATHPRYLQSLHEVCKESNYTEFTETFKKCLLYLFTHPSKESNLLVIRCLDFCAMFTTALQHDRIETDDNVVESQFLLEICEYLFKIHSMNYHAGRFRCCHLIGNILSQLANRDISENLYEEIKHILLIRVLDIKHFVRHSAIQALKFFQDPTNPDDPVTEAFINRLGDSNPKVRAAVVDVINPRQDVLPLLIMRTKDTDLTARYTAFKRFIRIPVTCLQIVQRQQLLKRMLSETNIKIRTLIIDRIIPSWLESYDNDCFKLLSGLRLDNDDLSIKKSLRLMEGIIKIFYKTKSINDSIQVLQLNETNLVHISNLNWETAVYWKTILSCIKEEESNIQDAVEEIVPDLVHLCSFIKRYYESMQNVPLDSMAYDHFQVILQQLFAITLLTDVSDVAGRSSLQTVTKQILQEANLSLETIKTVFRNINKVLLSIDRRVECVCEIISNVQHPLCPEGIEHQREKEVEISKQREQIAFMSHELNGAVTVQDFEKAANLKTEIAEKQEQLATTKLQLKDINVFEEKTDVHTLCKCLDILDCFLRSLGLLVALPAGLDSLKATFTRNLLIHMDSKVRSRALKCYGLFCLGDLEEVQKQLPIFCAPLAAYREKSCDVETAIISIKIVADLLGIYGPALMEIPEGNNNIDSESDCETTLAIFRGGVGLTEIIQTLVDLMMKDEIPEIRQIAGIGLTNLFAIRRISAPFVLSRLLLKWCYPSSEHEDDEEPADVKLRCCIGKLLEHFSREGDEEFADKLLKAYLLAMKVLINAPRTSPYAEVSVENVSKLIIEIYRNCAKTDDCDSKFAVELLNEMITHPQYKCVMIYSKVFISMRLAKSDRCTIKEFLKCCNTLCDSLTSTKAIKCISKVETMLNKLLSDMVSESKEIPEESSDESNQSSVDIQNRVITEEAINNADKIVELAAISEEIDDEREQSSVSVEIKENETVEKTHNNNDNTIMKSIGSKCDTEDESFISCAENCE